MAKSPRKTFEVGLDEAGEETYRALAGVHRLSTAIDQIRDLIEEIESKDRPVIEQSLFRVLDILTLLKNHVFIASTDSAFLIELLDLMTDDRVMLKAVLDEVKESTLIEFRNSVAAEIESRKSNRSDPK